MSEIKEVDIVDAENVELRQQYNGQQTSAGGLILTPKIYEFIGDDAKEKGYKFIHLVKEELKKLSKEYKEEAIIFWRQRPCVTKDKDFDTGEVAYSWIARFTTWPPSPSIHLIYNSLNSPKAES